MLDYAKGTKTDTKCLKTVGNDITISCHHLIHPVKNLDF